LRVSHGLVTSISLIGSLGNSVYFIYPNADLQFLRVHFEAGYHSLNKSCKAERWLQNPQTRMRLLKCERTTYALDKFENVKFITRNFNTDKESLPPYAILSHTWHQNESEELDLSDIESGTGHQKLGYHKLIFCAEQAAKAGLEYFWIDTCCINQKSAVELAC
jgi:hypothetical protein